MAVVNSHSYSNTGGATQTLPWTPAVGNLLIVFMASNNGYTVNGGWTEKLAGNSFWYNRISMMFRIVESGDTATIAPCNASGDVLGMIVYEYDASDIPPGGIDDLQIARGQSTTEFQSETIFTTSQAAMGVIVRGGSGPAVIDLPTGGAYVSNQNDGGNNRYAAAIEVTDYAPGLLDVTYTTSGVSEAHWFTVIMGNDVPPPGLQVSESRALVVLSYLTQEVRMPQARAYAVINFPTQEIQASQFHVNTVVNKTGGLKVSQTRTIAIAKGRTSSRKVRCWTFTLDGHDFYVIHLGDAGSLVYDLTTGQWMQWSSPNLRHWRANCGANWVGMGGQAFVDGANTKVVAGDDNNGVLWTLEPEQGYDQATRDSLPDQAFTRKVVGGVPMRMRETQKVGAAYLTANLGSPQITAANVTLRTSVDDGNNWTDHGTITVEPGNYGQEFVWRSLGLIRAPGMIFEITDNGAAVRIDGLDTR